MKPSIKKIIKDYAPTFKALKEYDEKDALIRDLTRVVPMSKSEARRRIEELLDRAYEEGLAEGIADGYKNFKVWKKAIKKEFQKWLREGTEDIDDAVKRILK